MLYQNCSVTSLCYPFVLRTKPKTGIPTFSQMALFEVKSHLHVPQHFFYFILIFNKILHIYHVQQVI